jgi:hypothetical protein
MHMQNKDIRNIFTHLVPTAMMTIRRRGMGMRQHGMVADADADDDDDDDDDDEDEAAEGTSGELEVAYAVVSMPDNMPAHMPAAVVPLLALPGTPLLLLLLLLLLPLSPSLSRCSLPSSASSVCVFVVAGLRLSLP